MEAELRVPGKSGRLCGVPFELEERFVIAAEQELGASLPYSYRQAMMTSNGGQVLAYDDGICIPSWIHPIVSV